MNTYQSTPDFYRDYIQHFNKNHDPKNGQFTSGHGGSVSINKKVNIENKVKEKTKSNDFSSTEKKQLNNKELKNGIKMLKRHQLIKCLPMKTNLMNLKKVNN